MPRWKSHPQAWGLVAVAKLLENHPEIKGGVLENVPDIDVADVEDEVSPLQLCEEVLTQNGFAYETKLVDLKDMHKAARRRFCFCFQGVHNILSVVYPALKLKYPFVAR